MSTGIELKVLPLTYKEFLVKYNGILEKEGKNTKTEYKTYLECNRNQHHYNGNSLEDWYSSQIIV